MGISFCILESNDGGERNLHATLYDESKQIYYDPIKTEEKGWVADYLHYFPNYIENI